MLNDTVIHSYDKETQPVFDKLYHQMELIVVSGCIIHVERNNRQGNSMLSTEEWNLNYQGGVTDLTKKWVTMNLKLS